jgi:hypothetical protein
MIRPHVLANAVTTVVAVGYVLCRLVAVVAPQLLFRGRSELVPYAGPRAHSGDGLDVGGDARPRPGDERDRVLGGHVLHC